MDKFVSSFENPKKTTENVINTLKTLRDLRRYKGPTVRNLYELDKSRRKYAHFASSAYSSLDSNDADHVKGYILDRQLSTPQFKVYTKDGEKKLVLACRGSAVAKDFLVSDIQITRGKEAQQMKELRSFYDKVENKYGDYSKVGVGHSLSGLSISRLQHETDAFRSVYAYNPGSSPFGGEEYQQYLKESFGARGVNVTAKEGDIVSAPMLRYAKNLQVIGGKGSIKDTLGHHFMNNFVENEHVKKISNLLDKHGVEKSDVIHELHQKNKSDKSLEKRHDILKQTLEGGSAMGINEGTYLGSGGWHNVYNPTPNSMTTWTDPQGKSHKIPGPGSKIYVNKRKGMMYTFGKNNEFIPLVGTLKQKSDALKRSKGYNQGPAVIYDASKSPPERGVAAVPSLGGMGLDFVDVTSPGKWMGALVGLDKGQLGGDGIKFLEGTKSKHGFVGNGMANPFETIQGTINDHISDKGLDVAEWLGHNAVSLMEMGVETVVGMASLGASQVVIQGVKAVIAVADQSGASDLAQAVVDKAIPDVRHDTMDNVSKMFDNAKDYETGTEDAFLSGYGYPDPRYTKDDRIPWRVDQLKKDWGTIRAKAVELDLSNRETKKMLKLSPFNSVENLPSQADQIKKLDELNRKYTFMKTSFDETKKLKTADTKASQVGLQAVTKQKYDTLRENMIPPSDTVNSYSPSYYTEQTDHVLTTLNNTVKEKTADAPKILSKYEDKQLDWESESTQQFLDTIASKKEYEKHFGFHVDFNKKGVDTSHDASKFKNYQRDMLKAYRTESGKYTAPSVDSMTKDDKFFYKKYLKKNPSIPEHKFVKTDYFHGRQEMFQDLQKKENEIREKIHNDIPKKAIVVF